MTDSGNLKSIKSLLIFVTDVNEAPYSIMLSSYQIPENQPANKIVATITVEDQDYNETFSCQLTQPSPFYFSLTANSTHITLVTTNATINNPIIRDNT